MKISTSTTTNGITTNTMDFESNIATGESNDCVVRAMTVGFNQKYNVVHSFCKGFFSREDRNGVHGVNDLDHSPCLFGQAINRLGRVQYDNSDFEYKGRLLGKEYSVGGGQKKFRQMSVGTFLKTYTEGTYLLVVRGHMFCIKDGEVFGNYDDGMMLKRPINIAYKIGKLTQEEQQIKREENKLENVN